MANNYNLPPGCTVEDIEGPPMPACNECGELHNDEDGNGLCPECQPKEEEPMKRICAHCAQEQGLVFKLGERVTHGICYRHALEFMRGLALSEGKLAEAAAKLASANCCPDLRDNHPAA